jgi:hypothetical protein
VVVVAAATAAVVVAADAATAAAGADAKQQPAAFSRKRPGKPGRFFCAQGPTIEGSANEIKINLVRPRPT